MGGAMRWLGLFFITLAHEAAWLVYVRAIARRYLLAAVAANALILLSGGALTYVVANDPLQIPVATAAGALGTLLFWRFLK